MPDDDTNPAMEAAVDNALAAPEPTPEPAPPVLPEPSAPSEPVEPPQTPEPPVPLPSEDDEDDTDLEPPKEGEPARQQILDLATSRGKRIYRSYKAFKEMTESLGFEPSLDDVRANYERASDSEAAEADFNSENLEDAANFVHQWHLKNPAGWTRIATVMPEYLARSGNTEAYASLAAPILQRYEMALRQRAGQATDQGMKDSLLHAARMLEWDRTGKWSDAPPETPGAPDQARDARIRDLEAREARIREFEQRQARSAAGGWQQDTNRNIAAAVTEDIDQALGQLKAQYEQNPFIWEALRDRFVRTVHQAVSQNVEGMRRFNLRYENALRSRSEQDRTDLVRLYRAMAARAIQTNRAQILKSATGELKRQSDQKHAQLQQAARQVAPTTSGAAAQRSILPRPPAGATKTEQLESAIDALFAR